MEPDRPFLSSVTQLARASQAREFPPDEGFEVAFMGRSNCGKSRIINTLLQRKRLTRVGKQPGCTRFFYFFMCDPQRRLVDLPGYGYAQVSVARARSWHALMARYIERRQSLQGVVLIMDIRHPLQALDNKLIRFLLDHQRRVHIVLNKADKLRPHEIFKTLQYVKDNLLENKLVSIQVFSARTRIGIDILRQYMEEFLILPN